MGRPYGIWRMGHLYMYGAHILHDTHMGYPGPSHTHMGQNTHMVRNIDRNTLQLVKKWFSVMMNLDIKMTLSQANGKQRLWGFRYCYCDCNCLWAEHNQTEF